MRKVLASLSLAIVATGCATDADDGSNPFAEELPDSGKEDTGYMNPDGIEVEVDLEGDIAAGTGSRVDEAGVAIGQFALTYFRKQEKMYIESLAEDGIAADRTEWLVGGAWKPASQVANAEKKHWRIRGLNTVLLFEHSRGVNVGKVFTAKVPLNPFSVLTDARDTCADDDDHISLDSSVYWYRWEGDKSTCTIPRQDLKVTVSKKFPTTQSTRYPEYDKLIADKKVTSVVLFGQIDDGALTENETGMRNFKKFGRNLIAAGYTKKTGAGIIGERYEKNLNGGSAGTIVAQIDLYSPREFSGLGDFAHFGNFQKALTEHEIVAYDGHSMLGASDFWARPTYPGHYQIFLYGGCLGYEYYIKPILHGKGDSWANLDLVSSVIEVTADANMFAAPAIAKILYSIEHGRRSSWRAVLLEVRNNVGDSTFGVSGVRDNCYKPGGSYCQ